ncbi:serine hydrolase domain-containing protein [Aliikangiella coralliicola]|uniref:Beta-lactamase family protein n=1 Tax=Aliikangiella coralliicola TaxID=2592383 RepID=A0A545UGA2_9GAMM|nr:serine hydrolase domain-containing protein [Aliikangiella coralliicola]TQV88506.1 beta-lactamase family protein [Aliikangiella coralliicola]
MLQYFNKNNVTVLSVSFSLLIILSVVALLKIAVFERKPRNFSEKVSEARSIFQKLASGYPSLSVAVVENGKTIWREAQGFADIEERRQATPDTIYPIYSISKGFSGILAAVMQAQGKLDIEKSVRVYLPDLPNHYQDVTVKHLLGHTGGVRHYRDAGKNYPPDGEWMDIANRHCENPNDILPLFIDDELVSTPGDYKNYSTFGYVLLSAALEAAGDKKYTELMQTLIFEKAGANRMYLDQANHGTEERASLYRIGERDYQAIPPIDNSCRFGGGGFVATATDLALIGSVYAAGGLVDENQMRRVATPIIPRKENSSTGYGFSVSKMESAGQKINILTNGGSALGARAYLYIIENKRIAVALTGNVKGAEMDEQAEKIAKIFADLD